MSLLICQECSGTVSEKAKACPNCGAPPSQFNGTPDSKKTDAESEAEDISRRAVTKKVLSRQEYFLADLEYGEFTLINGDPAGHHRSLSNDAGAAYLTTHRVVFCGGMAKDLIVNTFFPIIAAFKKVQVGPKITCQFMWSDIEDIKEEKKFFGKRWIFTLKSGESICLSFKRWDEWQNAFANLGLTVK
jgi:hypothetical protein